MKKILLLVCVLFLTSCASGQVLWVTHIPSGPQVRMDTYHAVAPCETLWRISKMYDVSIKDIMRNNNLCTSKLKIGQTLKILDAAPIRPVVPLYPCAKWKYIIIHHSATDTGNALSFNRSHNARGFENGLGYHFVIDNGTKGKNNGQIEVSGRWIKQQNGAHCKAANMNTKAIGVCLVGNFSEDRVSAKQLKSLAYLVNRLRRYYRIPKSRIIGHGRVKSARTECPGKKFPWQEFWSKLKSDI